MPLRVATVKLSEIAADPDLRLDVAHWVGKVEEPEDFPGIPAEDADEYEREVLLDETDGIPEDCTGYIDDVHGTLLHDGDTCPIHEED